MAETTTTRPGGHPGRRAVTLGPALVDVLRRAALVSGTKRLMKMIASAAKMTSSQTVQDLPTALISDRKVTPIRIMFSAARNARRPARGP